MSPDTPRRILLAVTGLTPQIVTETLYALACRGADTWIPHEIHLITTATGANNARLNLLAGERWFHRLCEDYALPSIAFTPEHIHVLRDAEGRPLAKSCEPHEYFQPHKTNINKAFAYTLSKRSAENYVIGRGKDNSFPLTPEQIASRHH
ncbi:hypothetical protein CKO25_11360 [Thiocapsa imhoffii]|uniref:CRISPR system ring nuclease SSO2081-like domain-containing protein n=1 Tax=Thiocapsa imhoffii TaxID=382777 RepID=A0A9X1B9E9_9GAMM|nr:CRISPR-associated ring nuclease [Thiocapsa imhoffii]MBK1645228.1 hypothetical protein [Thiocapsa imhoffii]